MVNHTRTETERSMSTLQTLPSAFADQAAPNGAAIAVRHGSTEWTYAELATRANRLTRFLQARGIGRGSLVPLVFRPVPEALQAMLAVLQAGAAYVPLDPGHASAR